ncbi:unnamed protein product [Fraxinus pennsylvanica]|uniref:Uncharacterized protein n=1 Tax=Fraxinus pennsylvanica TaxID=56036 RepID=A0AAD2DZ29_9LAMI|nr:unnamed protein product [Fraxinus pennsylvanica]
MEIILLQQDQRSSANPMTPKKLHIVDHNSKPKTKLGPPAAPQNSAPSSSTTTLPSDKRTRDLPNLSDCHCCGIRINHSNPKDQLQPLDSVWRIVLLCRKCSKKVQSGQTCSYCFKETANSGNIVECLDCARRIHQDCVNNYGDCTPWCYLGLGLGFRVCVDCWVPDLLKNSVRIHRRSDNKDVVKSCATEGDLKDCRQKGKKVECEVEKKVKMVAIGKKNSLRKSVVAKNAVELAETALDMAETVLDMADKNGKKGDDVGTDAVEVVDDVEFAIQLHRAMNSSPRNLRNQCVGKSSCFEILKSRNSDSLSSRKSGLGRNNGEGMNPETCINIMENEILIRTSDNDYCLHADNLKQGLLTYKRDRKRKLWQVDDNDCVVSESKYSQHVDSNDKLHLNGSGCQLRFNGVIYKRDKKRKLWHVDDDDAMDSESMFNQQDDLKYSLHSNGAKSGCPLTSNGDIYRRDKNRKLWQVDDDSVMVSKSEFTRQDLECPLNSSDAIERFRQEPIIYKRTRFRLKTCQENGKVLVFGECTSGFDNSVALEPQYYQQDDWKHELPLGDSRDSCAVKCDVEITLLPDRYFFKYGSRRTGAKSGSICETELHSDASQNENQAAVSSLVNRNSSWLVKCDDKLILSDGSLYKEPDPYFLKYGPRVTCSKSGSNCETYLHSDDLQKENQASAAGLTTNRCSKSRTLSNWSICRRTLDKTVYSKPYHGWRQESDFEMLCISLVIQWNL